MVLACYRSLWESKVSKLPKEVTDTTSGPGAPDFEFIGAPVTFLKHGTVSPPSGGKSFTIVSRFHIQGENARRMICTLGIDSTTSSQHGIYHTQIWRRL